MTVRHVDPGSIIRSEPDNHGGFDLLVDMNQVGLGEDDTPAAEIHIEGTKFFQAGLCDDGEHRYWSYWNDEAPAINLQLHLV